MKRFMQYAVPALWFSALRAFPQVADTTGMQDVSLSAVMDLKINVASAVKPQSREESPGIVSVITAEEIANSGARDLIDVLRMVPGFDVELDMSGELGLGIRGTWANEGKVLILVDGIDMNDELYLSFPFGQHIPVENIDRIEIVRGPGSAMYGGAAEFGVISIITKNAAKKFCGSADVTAGRTASVWSRTNTTISAGTNSGPSFSANGTVHFNQGYFSDRKGHDMYLDDLNNGSSDLSKTTAFHSNVAVRAGGFSTRFIADHFTVNASYPSDTVTKYPVYFDSYLGKIRYDAKLSDNVQATPSFQAKIQMPWNTGKVFKDNGAEKQDWEYNLTTMKYTVTLPFSVVLRENLNLLAGANEDLMQGRDNSGNSFNGKNAVSYNNSSVYAEGLLNSAAGNFTLGGRADYHNQYGFSAVPRFCFTRSFSRGLYVKTLLSEAFRAPSMDNIAYNKEIKPEHTDVFETEIGDRPISWILCSLNGFAIQTRKAIIYMYDEMTQTDIYKNAGTMRSGGFEFVLKAKTQKGYVNVTYSYSRQLKSDLVTPFTVPGVHDRNLALPSQKITAEGSWTLGNGISLTPSLVFLGNRWGIDYIDSSSNYVYNEFNSSLLLNLCVSWQVPGAKGVNISLSGHNLLNDEFSFLEAYQGSDGPLPGLSRELTIRATYSF